MHASLSTLIATVVLAYSFVLMVDPYDSLSFSLPFDRVQVTTSQRFFYPALARSPQFDSAIIGNSSIRLLRPAQLNGLLGGRFVNLGMDAATSWEQRQIFNVFRRSHPSIRNVLVGLDSNWCSEEGTDQKFSGTSAADEFPAWLFDESAMNDLPPLNSTSLQTAWKQLQVQFGLREQRFGNDGYTVFTNPEAEYVIAKARLNIYGADGKRQQTPQFPPVAMSPEERRAIPLPALHRLREMLDTLPVETRKILLFTPLHSFHQPSPGSSQEQSWNECKTRVVALTATLANAFVLDAMVLSEITAEDSNYWDPVHYKVAVAELIGGQIGQAVNQHVASPGLVLLHLPADDDVEHP